MLTVDYLLGDNRNRYFGRGHKRTTYEVKLKNILEGVALFIRRVYGLVNNLKSYSNT